MERVSQNVNICDILYTLKPDIAVDLIKEARWDKGLEKNNDHDEMIEIIPDFWDEILTLVNVKGRILITLSYWSIVSRGRTPYLFKNHKA